MACISRDSRESEGFGKKIGYNSSTISHIISGVKSVSGKFVQNLCSLSDKVNPNYLLSDDPVMLFADDRHRSIHEYVAGQQKSIEEAAEKLTALQSSDGYLLVPVYNFDAVGGMNAANDITDRRPILKNTFLLSGRMMKTSAFMLLAIA